MHRKVLIITKHFPPARGTAVNRIFAVTKYLPGFGYEPTVLTHPGTGYAATDVSQLQALPDCAKVVRIRPPHVDDWPGYVNRHLRWLGPVETALRKPRGWVAEGVAWRLPVLFPGIDVDTTWTNDAIRVGLKLVHKIRPDVVLATAPEFENLKIAHAICQHAGIPFVADFRDPWTYGVMWNPRSRREALAELAWERKILSRAAHVVVVTPSMKTRMASDFPIHANKITTITNGFDDLPKLEPVPRRPEKMIISYVGGLSPYRAAGLNPLFDAFKQLREEQPQVAADLLFQFVGHSIVAGPLEDNIRSRGLEAMVACTGSVSVNASKSYMRASDVLLLLEPVAPYVICSKHFEYMAARRPILGMVMPGSDDEGLLRQSGAGITVNPTDLRQIAHAIVSFWTDWKAGRLQTHVQEDWLQQFHRRNLTGRMAGVLDTVIADGRRRATAKRPIALAGAV